MGAPHGDTARSLQKKLTEEESISETGLVQAYERAPSGQGRSSP
jgi:hypothetical protein